MDLGLAVAGLFIGAVVGLTGMGGGALMTPVLVLFFGVPPLAAVSSDLVVSAVMKPVGGLVHLRNGTVNLGLVKLLMLGSVPSAFAGVLVIKALGDDETVQEVVKVALGVALLIATASLVGKAWLGMRDRARRHREGLPPEGSATGRPDVVLRPVPTVLVGVLGGLIVGMTSVGSGSLIIIALLALYPALHASQLVGTDLVQAVPLVASAAVGHMLFGDFQLDVTTSLLVGALPGVYVGARFSSRANGGLVRRALTLVLLASGLKLVGVPNVALGWCLLAVCVAGPLAWAWARRRAGLPATGRRERAARAGRDGRDGGDGAGGPRAAGDAADRSGSTAR
ncbi:sulfite exporter TauE/SafE family protein [Vallicoccus soli]|uniref:Probable membrane transporter protein n=1 Tax=Vallicoccus soli TaxID=2339232 RepID=A0A3A3Z0X0_9ACTN|nr:sulfite exporter TauE/SafE family protein [Vallicoccus soli]RJK97899.1 sulfite exporter TauE/SafE family protein [Vallicoccus soli]